MRTAEMLHGATLKRVSQAYDHKGFTVVVVAEVFTIYLLAQENSYVLNQNTMLGMKKV